MLIGAHLPVDNNYKKLFLYAKKLNLTHVQIFTASNRQWNIDKNISDDRVALYIKEKEKNSIKFLSHACYLINCISDDEEIRRKSQYTLISEMNRCKQLGIKEIVVHWGSTKEKNKIEYLTQKSLDFIFTRSPEGITLCYENSAGQGNTYPYSYNEIEELQKILQKNEYPLGWCIDTCHAMSAGYNLSKKNESEEFLLMINRIIDVSYIKYFHLNDSKYLCGSKKDRHEFLGKGTIGKDFFKTLIKNKKYENIPKILETPIKSPWDFEKDIMLLKE